MSTAITWKRHLLRPKKVGERNAAPQERIGDTTYNSSTSILLPTKTQHPEEKFTCESAEVLTAVPKSVGSTCLTAACAI